MQNTRRLAEWGLEKALPYWAARGWDTTHGGFYETLDLNGVGLHGDTRRVRVQARQAYVFARAAHEGWLDRLDLAVDGLALLRERAWQAGGKGGWAHTLTDDGQVKDARRDLYDHAFVILALAWTWRATGDDSYKALADETLAFVEREMASRQGGFLESIGGPQLPRRQNPHMHLFEALMALYEISGDASLLDRIHDIRSLFDRHFFDAGHGVLREFFDESWGHHPDTGDVIEPGHLCEWVWLLSEYERLTGKPAGAASDALYKRAMACGVNPRTGLLYASMTPTGSVIDSRSRSWMQTEWIRAAAIETRRGTPGALQTLEAACGATFRHHLDPAPAGAWIDANGEDGSTLSTGMPSSTLYHMLGSVIEARAVVAMEADLLVSG